MNRFQYVYIHLFSSEIKKDICECQNVKPFIQRSLFFSVRVSSCCVGFDYGSKRETPTCVSCWMCMQQLPVMTSPCSWWTPLSNKHMTKFNKWIKGIERSSTYLRLQQSMITIENKIENPQFSASVMACISWTSAWFFDWWKPLCSKRSGFSILFLISIDTPWQSPGLFQLGDILSPPNSSFNSPLQALFLKFQIYIYIYITVYYEN